MCFTTIMNGSEKKESTKYEFILHTKTNTEMDPNKALAGWTFTQPPLQLPCRASLARSSSCSFWASCTRISVTESTSAEQPPWVSSRSLLSMSFICRSRLTSSCSWATSSRSRTATRKWALSKRASERTLWVTYRGGPGLQANTLLSFLFRSTAWWGKNLQSFNCQVTLCSAQLFLPKAEFLFPGRFFYHLILAQSNTWVAKKLSYTWKVETEM